MILPVLAMILLILIVIQFVPVASDKHITVKTNDSAYINRAQGFIVGEIYASQKRV